MKGRIAAMFALLVLALTMSFSVNAQTQSTTPATKPTVYLVVQVKDGDTLGTAFAASVTTQLQTEFTVVTVDDGTPNPAPGSELVILHLTPSTDPTIDGVALFVIQTNDGSTAPGLLGAASDILTAAESDVEAQSVLGYADDGYQQLVAQNQK